MLGSINDDTKPLNAHSQSDNYWEGSHAPLCFMFSIPQAALLLESSNDGHCSWVIALKEGGVEDFPRTGQIVTHITQGRSSHKAL